MAHETVLDFDDGRDGLSIVRSPETGDLGFRVWRRSPSGVLRSSGVTWVPAGILQIEGPKPATQHGHDSVHDDTRKKCVTGRCQYRTTYTTNPDGICDRHPRG